jgi:CubicO group peptidase (beta-lactamase class C family)/D-alanyl-D-alanine dipeptidase
MSHGPRSHAVLFLLAASLVGGCVSKPGADPDSVAAAAPYAPVATALTSMIEREMRQKRIPGVSIALVDHGKTVWARGFGMARPSDSTLATANTVYRIGSVSKLFTDIGIMQLVERGELNLDAPITQYLPDFHPVNPFGVAITLRQLMSHRAGLTREPPVGNYFDSTDTALEHMVASLNGTTLVYAPGTRTKYSNAGIGTVGYVLQKLKGQPFARYLKQAVLFPTGLTSSAFEPEPALVKRLAAGRMWTLHGTEFTAPTFQLGMSPAGSMYSTVHDLVRFMQMLFARGQGANGAVLKRETLESMWQPQFGGTFGLGFALDTVGGHRVVGHGGAIYGFATEIRALPDDSVGVVVIGTKDCVNQVMSHVARSALEMILALKAGRTLPIPDSTGPVPEELGRRIAGRYSNGKERVDVRYRLTSGSTNPDVPGLRAGVVYFSRSTGEFRSEIRRLRGDTLIVDDEFVTGPVVTGDGKTLSIGHDTFARVPDPLPPDAPAGWLPLIGEYGWDHDVLYIFEKDQQLYALIEWFTEYPLKQLSDSTFQFPDNGLYLGERMVFHKDASGRVSGVTAANVLFKRRPVGPEPGAPQLKVKPIRPIDDLRKEALAAKPPQEKGVFLPSSLTEVITLDPTVKLDVRYATTNNFFGAVFYDQARTFLQRPAADALIGVHRALKPQGYGLLLHDGYRPWYVSKMFWEGTPQQFRIFVANPAEGSKHNRGAAIDLNMFDLKTGKPIEQVGTYDEFSNRSFPEYPGGTSRQRWHRELLRSAMEGARFHITETEWWHFDYQDWPKYAIGNLRFDEIGKK